MKAGRQWGCPLARGVGSNYSSNRLTRSWLRTETSRGDSWQPALPRAELAGLWCSRSCLSACWTECGHTGNHQQQMSDPMFMNVSYFGKINLLVPLFVKRKGSQEPHQDVTRGVQDSSSSRRIVDTIKNRLSFRFWGHVWWGKSWKARQLSCTRIFLWESFSSHQ